MVNKAFITFCFPLNEPWTLASMDLLSTGKSLNEELMKTAMKLIKKVLFKKKKSIFIYLFKTKYLLFGGLEFMGFYVNCSNKDLKTYETKLINPLSAKLAQKNSPELINIYHILDNQSNIVFHNKGSNSEKIDQKSQNVFDSFMTISSKVTYSGQINYKPEDFLENVRESLKEKTAQMEKCAIVTLDDILILNEQESLDYYLKNKNTSSAFDFHLELDEATFPPKENSVLVKGDFVLNALVHKKATVAECKKVETH